MQPETAVRALVVDADREAASRLARSLGRDNPDLALHPVGTVAAALEVLEGRREGEEHWDAVVCTIGKRHAEGLELVRLLAERSGRPPVLLLGEAEDLEAAVEGLKLGACDFLIRDSSSCRRLAPRLRQAIDRLRVRARRELLLPALDALPDAVLVADARGRVLAANRGCAAMFGMSEDEMAGQPFESLLVEGPANPLSREVRALQPAESLQDEVTALRADGTHLMSLATAVRGREGDPPLLLILRDITHWKELQDQLLQREKLSALGELISGVAHELNNPLTGVLGFSQLVMGRADCSERIRRDLRTIFEQAQRCERIVQNLLSFARKTKPEQRLLGINGVLDSTVALLDYQMRVDNIRVEKDFEEDLPKTMGDYHQLQQVFLNLITNAHQAMVMGKKGSRLLLRTRSRGDRLRIEISDDGPGIPEDVLPRVFDPFFTTKPKGLGTGLGLSLCFGIVSEHGGSIQAHSQTGQGATFAIELPVRREPSGAREDRAAEPAERPRPEQRNVLVADDEEPILDLLFEMLSAEGHRVDIARDGAVALRKIEREAYDLLISDIRMPGCDGRRLYERWRSLYPERARSVLFTTGDTASEETREFLAGTGVQHVEKPFNLQELMQLIRALLSSQDTSCPAAAPRPAEVSPSRGGRRP